MTFFSVNTSLSLILLLSSFSFDTFFNAYRVSSDFLCAIKTLPKDPSPIFDLIIKSVRDIAFLKGLFYSGVLYLGESQDGIFNIS
jgi:hypothetical protein